MTYQSELPAALKHSFYCQHCYDQEVTLALEEYDRLVELAENAYIVSINAKIPLPVLKKAKERVAAKDCVDRNEVVMRLAFQAVRQGYNAVIETRIEDKKVRNEGWQKTSWSGSGLPALVDGEKMERRYR